jgi:hypothetical protein
MQHLFLMRRHVRQQDASRVFPASRVRWRRALRDCGDAHTACCVRVCVFFFIFMKRLHGTFLKNGPQGVRSDVIAWLVFDKAPLRAQYSA